MHVIGELYCCVGMRWLSFHVSNSTTLLASFCHAPCIRSSLLHTMHKPRENANAAHSLIVSRKVIRRQPCLRQTSTVLHSTSLSLRAAIARSLRPRATRPTVDSTASPVPRLLVRSRWLEFPTARPSLLLAPSDELGIGRGLLVLSAPIEGTVSRVLEVDAPLTAPQDSFRPMISFTC